MSAKKLATCLVLAGFMFFTLVISWLARADVTVYDETWTTNSTTSSPVVPTITGSSWITGGPNGFWNVYTNSNVAGTGWALGYTNPGNFSEGYFTTNFSETNGVSSYSGNIRLTEVIKLPQQAQQAKVYLRGTFQNYFNTGYCLNVFRGYGRSNSVFGIQTTEMNVAANNNPANAISIGPYAEYQVTSTYSDYITLSYAITGQNPSTLDLRVKVNGLYAIVNGTVSAGVASTSFVSTPSSLITFTNSDIPQVTGDITLSGQNNSTIPIYWSEVKVEQVTTDTRNLPPYSTITNYIPMYTWTGSRMIQQHGGAVYNEGWYYVYVNSKTLTYPKLLAGFGGGRPQSVSAGVRLYRSRDLVNWEDQGIVTNDAGQTFQDHATPKVIFNPTSKKWVMFATVTSDISVAAPLYCGIYTADNPIGPFTYQATLGVAGFGDSVPIKVGVSCYLIYQTNPHVKGVLLSPDYLSAASSEVAITSLDNVEGFDTYTIGGNFHILASSQVAWKYASNTYDFILSTASTPITDSWSSNGSPFQPSAIETTAWSYRTQNHTMFADAQGTLRWIGYRFNYTNLADDNWIHGTVTFSGNVMQISTYSTTITPPLIIGPLPLGGL